MKLFTLIIAGLTLLLPPAVAAPVVVAPDQLIKNVSGEVLEIIRKDKDIQAGNNKKVLDLVDAKVLPHFNFAHMTQNVLGKNWKKASPAQQKILTDELRVLLVRIYSVALTQYRDQIIEFRPFAMKPGETEVRVRTQVYKPDNKANKVSLDYLLELLPEGWKVYDIKVDDVSLAANYRDEFANKVSTSGIDGLVAYLQTKNRGADAK